MQISAAHRVWDCMRSGSTGALAKGPTTSYRSSPTQPWTHSMSFPLFSIVSRYNEISPPGITDFITMTQNKTLPAYFALGIGILALSFSAMFVRWANAPGPVTAFYRLFFSLFLLLPFFAPRVKTNPAVRSSFIVFPLLAGIFTACDLGLWTASLTYTTASNATLLGNTAPLWVALGAWLILKQKLTPAFWRGLVLALFGAALIMGTDFILHPRLGIGDVMAVSTGLFYGAYFLVTEKSRLHFDPVSHIWIVGVGASLSLFLIN